MACLMPCTRGRVPIVLTPLWIFQVAMRSFMLLGVLTLVAALVVLLVALLVAVLVEAFVEAFVVSLVEKGARRQWQWI